MSRDDAILILDLNIWQLDFSRALNLKRPTLHEVDFVLSLIIEIHGKLNVHRIVVCLMQDMQHLLHGFNESGLLE